MSIYLIHGGARDSHSTGYLRDGLAADERQAHRIALQIDRVGLLHFLLAASPSFRRSILQRFPYSTNSGEVQLQMLNLRALHF